jgi:hypothetical protein
MLPHSTVPTYGAAQHLARSISNHFNAQIVSDEVFVNLIRGRREWRKVQSEHLGVWVA